ncbi:MAG: hypothetical protein KDD46_05555 [Bdellovibrionales bacterium]|nr:hypothetical protein [Bdellovibrionales bacterium]
MQVKIPLPKSEKFVLSSVIQSHGWVQLPPFSKSQDNTEISFALSETPKNTITLSQKQNKLIVRSTKKLTKRQLQIVSSMIGLDKTLSPFYTLALKHRKQWVSKMGMGRFLRSESVFEDLIKLVLTTNCTWSLTKTMVNNLCQKLGEPSSNGSWVFPSAITMAKKNEAYYRNVIRTGYRSKSLAQIAKMVASGKLDVESWKDHTQPLLLKKEMLALPGVGPYVAENLLKFLGFYDGLGLDSWVRSQLQEQWNLKELPKDARIKKYYEQFSPFQGLMLWCDVTKSWLQPEKSQKFSK